MDLEALLAEPPLFEHRMMDVRAHAQLGDADRDRWLRCSVVRLFTGDPFEGSREGPDRFLANHVLDEPEIVLYLSWGEAAGAARGSSWDGLLRTAFATAITAGVDHPEVMEAGAYAGKRFADQVADLSCRVVDPLGGEITWDTTGWTAWTMGTIVDLVEEREGSLGYDPAPLDFTEATEPDPACRVCAGENLYAPHVPALVFDTMCVAHLRQWDELSANRLPEIRPAARKVLSDILSSLDMMIVPSGLRTFMAHARAAGLEAETELIAELRSVLPGVDEEVLGLVLAETEDIADWLLDVLERISNLDPDRGLRLGDQIRDVAPGLCWAVDLDRADRSDGSVLEEALDHLAGHGPRIPICYVLAGEAREKAGDRATARSLFWKGLARGAAVDHVETCRSAVDALVRVDPGVDPTRFEAAVASGRLSALRPGRNEACLCGSGVKSKRCCG